MWRLPRPNLSAEDSFVTCIQRTKDADVKTRLTAIAPSIAAAGAEYLAEAAIANLHVIGQHDGVGDVTGEELGKVYRNGMLRKGAPGRSIYDDLMTAPPHGRCPLCGVGQVKTLDHHLPKGNFPALVVNPANLVPACSDCNTAKLEYCPTCPDDEALHPYFDDLADGHWLTVTILESAPAGATFEAVQPPGWSATLFNRVAGQFKRLGLARLYAGNAANEIIEIRHQMARLHDTGGPVAVATELRARAESSAAHQPVSWRVALFRGLAASEWYCSGGF